MMVAVGPLVLIGGIAAWIWYQSWLRQGLKARRVLTMLPEDRVRLLFQDRVARLGWTIIDDDNPLVAQSPILAGRRQQIALMIHRRPEGHLALQVAPSRVWYKGLARVPYKAHTLRMRINSFVAAVATEDPVARVTVAA
jgi:hypothetical protein